MLSKFAFRYSIGAIYKLSEATSRYQTLSTVVQYSLDNYLNFDAEALSAMADQDSFDGDVRVFLRLNSHYQAKFDDLRERINQALGPNYGVREAAIFCCILHSISN